MVGLVGARFEREEYMEASQILVSCALLSFLLLLFSPFSLYHPRARLRPLHGALTEADLGRLLPPPLLA